MKNGIRVGLANASSSGFLFRFETTYDFGEDLKESVWRGSLNSQRLDAQPKASGTRISVSANKTSPITPVREQASLVGHPRASIRQFPGSYRSRWPEKNPKSEFALRRSRNLPR